MPYFNNNLIDLQVAIKMMKKISKEFTKQFKMSKYFISKSKKKILKRNDVIKRKIEMVEAKKSKEYDSDMKLSETSGMKIYLENGGYIMVSENSDPVIYTKKNILSNKFNRKALNISDMRMND
jgi:hypothetical protein